MNCMKAKCKVVHHKKSKFDIYIGRPSKWGNPFTHYNLPQTSAKFQCTSRQESIDKYEEWLTNGDGKHLLKRLHELKGKVLGCWCKPRACHGDILARLANKL